MFFKKKSPSHPVGSVSSRATAPLVDDLSKDTLAAMLRMLGEFALPTKQISVADFKAEMESMAKKMLVGAGMEDGAFGKKGMQRIYAEIKQQVRAQRKAESTEYSNHRQSASIIVADLVAGLRRTLESRRGHDEGIVRALSEMEAAVEAGNLDNIKRVCSQTVLQIKDVVAVQRERDQKQLEELSGQLRTMKEELLETQSEMQRDALTGVLNRGAFDDTFHQTVDIANASAMELTLYMMDLDHFKKVNDTYGHQGGDLVLKEVGKQLIRCFPRKDDMVFRYGGEEFAILCRNTGTDDAFMLAERVRKQISALTIEFDSVDYHQTVSVGWAVISPQETAETFLKRADDALYMAKKNGRDRVEPQ